MKKKIIKKILSAVLAVFIIPVILTGADPLPETEETENPLPAEEESIEEEGIEEGVQETEIPQSDRSSEFPEPDFDVRVSGELGVLNFRSDPGTQYQVLSELTNGEILHITDLSYNSQDHFLWGFTSYQDMEGWVSLRQTTILYEEGYSAPEFYGIVVSEGQNVPVREKAEADSYALTEVPDGQKLHITDLSYNTRDGLFWGKTRYNGMDGWISMAQIVVDHSGVLPVTWDQAYETFVLDQEYVRKNGDVLPDTEIFLEDLDEDRVPELFVYSGDGTREQDRWDVYFFRNEKVSPAGQVEGLPYGNDPDGTYMGMFFTDGTDNTGTEKYITLEDGTIAEEIILQRYIHEERNSMTTDVITDSNDLHRALKRAREALNADYYTLQDITSMGWEQFLAAFGYQISE